MMLRVAGMFLLVMGIIWMLQGTGLLGWPRDSFMIGQQAWIARGLALAATGAALVGIVHVRRRR
jgi:hypothetical protein